jgi:CDP-6-deoxy-D-xylo-4-hexulose-3-dehydrase
VLRWFDYTISGSLPNAEQIDKAGFFIGNHHYPLETEFELLRGAIDEAVSWPASRRVVGA